ncbi:2-dehydro-3-deoxygalactonokinase [Paracoccus sp. (in: a-proteobacteria)]|uniref:2-dehydro-3-deoxygalactonokinase n=1 Tax=Paracoccus sp. TaxID=267 RepID=UPI0035B13A2D
MTPRLDRIEAESGAVDPSAIDWIAVDWGTSALRVWAMQGARVLAEARSDQGMGRLTPEQFEPALLDLIGDWLRPGRTCPVLAAGMVGARQGWVEAPYLSVPCPPVAAGDAAGGAPGWAAGDTAGAAITVPTRDPRIAMRIIPGLSQADPADVMRGEEVQIAGVLARWPGFSGTVCLPGTHTKWATIAKGQVTQFRTLMTGEMFELLAARSVLRLSLAPGGTDMGAFRDGLRLAQGADVALQLFSLRAESLLGSPDPVALRARLSGLLIGQELAATRPLWQGRDIVIVASAGLEPLYLAALESLGATARRLSATEATLAGLCLAR